MPKVKLKPFTKVSSVVHPRNLAFLQSESKRTGQSVSALMNDAVTILARMYQGQPALGVRE